MNSFKIKSLALAYLGGTALMLCSCNNTSKELHAVLIDKPSDDTPEIREMKKYPPRKGFTELPFIEKTLAPTPSEMEKKTGFMLFRRPIMEIIYPNTKPLPQERISHLEAFATPGEFEPVSFALYPFIKLDNLKVRVSNLKSNEGSIIPQENINVWLLAYWNIRYPRYTSNTWRRTPELLENVTIHNVPAEETQRYWLRIKTPNTAKPGVYYGNVTVSHDKCNKALQIPLRFRVLPFRLLKDPNKHYSAYNYNLEDYIDEKSGRLRNKAKTKGKKWAYNAAKNEYKAMVEYGLDTAPTLRLRYDPQNKKFYIRNGDNQVKNILDAGMSGPIPLAGCGIRAIYKEYTGEKMKGHCVIPVMPPEVLYKQLTRMTIEFEKERKAKGWPEFIYVPLDEVAVGSRDFGVNVYKAFKEAGVKTYATKNPKSSDAAAYAPYVDFWCCQPYSTPYEEVVKSKNHGYWSYPNHNLNENRRTNVRIKGGRMTYGFGYWRSGFTLLIPWIWRSSNPDEFSKYAACGNQFDEKGNVMPAVYWECFREGMDDAKYIYTLQTAIVQREDSKDKNCREAAKKSKQLLQEIWDSIKVQQKYLNKDMWPSEEFNAIRWRMALAIMELYKYPTTNSKPAPSVIVNWQKAEASNDAQSIIKKEQESGNLEILDLGEQNYKKWKQVTNEGQKKIDNSRKRKNKESLLFDVKIDHKLDGGGENGNYPIGWPRLTRSFPNDGIDLSKYDYITLWVMVDSDRDEVADDFSPLYIAFSSKLKKGTLLLQTIINDIPQRVWFPVRLSLKDLIGEKSNEKYWRHISGISLGLCESKYAHGDRLRFYFDDIFLIKFKNPVISSTEIPANVILPTKNLVCNCSLMGFGCEESGNYTLNATMLTENGKKLSGTSVEAASKKSLFLPCQNIKPGTYQLKLQLKDKEGNVCSEKTERIEAVKGPFWK